MNLLNAYLEGVRVPGMHTSSHDLLVWIPGWMFLPHSLPLYVFRNFPSRSVLCIWSYYRRDDSSSLSAGSSRIESS
jgi:hypothetical protein